MTTRKLPPIPRIEPANESTIELYGARMTDSNYEDYHTAKQSRFGFLIKSDKGLGFIESRPQNYKNQSRRLSGMSARNLMTALRYHLSDRFASEIAEEFHIYCNGHPKTLPFLQTRYNSPGLEIPFDTAFIRALSPLEVIHVEGMLDEFTTGTEPRIRLVYYPKKPVVMAPKAPRVSAKQRKEERIVKRLRQLRALLKK